jgi:hypothetical protein
LDITEKKIADAFQEHSAYFCDNLKCNSLVFTEEKNVLKRNFTGKPNILSHFTSPLFLKVFHYIKQKWSSINSYCEGWILNTFTNMWTEMIVIWLEVSSPGLAGKLRNTMKEYQSEQRVSGPGFEHGIFWKRSRSFAHVTSTFGQFFFICIVGGGVQTGSTRHVGHSLAYCTCPGW